MLRRIVGEAITLEIETTERPLIVRAEPGHIEQVMMNLVINARDAIPAAGRIRIGVSEVNLDTRAVAAYPGMPPGHFARIRVHDSGAGIPPDLQSHVFEPFFTTKSHTKGSGLGLSIVYGIAQDAGGTVSFSTSVDEGTTFEVLLPMDAQVPSAG
jgi:signal transduction histidine kinase